MFGIDSSELMVIALVALVVIGPKDLPRVMRTVGHWVGQARGMSVHESQSLLLEMQASRSRPFIGFVAPLAREAFGGDGPAWDEDNLHRLYTRVRPDFIRVDADEVTYPAHVILRYRLERALIAGDMTLDDLPAAWNAGMQELLGIVPAQGTTPGNPLQSMMMFVVLEIQALQARFLQINEDVGRDLIAFDNTKITVAEAA